jgi:hypothetical protein
MKQNLLRGHYFVLYLETLLDSSMVELKFIMILQFTVYTGLETLVSTDSIDIINEDSAMQPCIKRTNKRSSLSENRFSHCSGIRYFGRTEIQLV